MKASAQVKLRNVNGFRNEQQRIYTHARRVRFEKASSGGGREWKTAFPFVVEVAIFPPLPRTPTPTYNVHDEQLSASHSEERMP